MPRTVKIAYLQTLAIETNAPGLGKRPPLFRRPALPIVYRVRLGEGFAPPTDVVDFTAALDRHYRRELEGSPQARWPPCR